MALLPLFRSRTREAELEHRVYALQAALAQCKGVARSWWSMRVRLLKSGNNAMQNQSLNRAPADTA